MCFGSHNGMGVVVLARVTVCVRVRGCVCVCDGLRANTKQLMKIQDLIWTTMVLNDSLILSVSAKHGFDS